MVSVIRLLEETAHLLVFFEEAVVFLLQLAYFDEGWGQGGHLVGGEPQRSLQLRDGLLELGEGEEAKVRVEEAYLFDVGLSLCTMASLCFCITASLWTIGL